MAKVPCRRCPLAIIITQRDLYNDDAGGEGCSGQWQCVKENYLVTDDGNVNYAKKIGTFDI